MCIQWAHSVFNDIDQANRLADAIILVQGQKAVQFVPVALLNLYIRLPNQQSLVKLDDQAVSRKKIWEWGRAGHKPGSVLMRAWRTGGQLSIWDTCYQVPQADGQKQDYSPLCVELGKNQPLFRGLASNRGLPSQHLSMLLVRSYRTFAPLP